MFSTAERHHPHFDAERPWCSQAYSLKVCGNELEGFHNVRIRPGECGSLPALLELLEERLHLGVVTNVALHNEDPGEDEEEFEELTELDLLPTSPEVAVLRVQSKCTAAIRYPRLQPFHHHPYKLHDAAAAGDTKEMKNLLASGASISERVGCRGGRTPLHHASTTGRGLAVEVLLEASAAAVAAGLETPITAVHAADSSGCMPVHLAARHGHLDVLAQLLAADATLDAKVARGGWWHSTLRFALYVALRVCPCLPMRVGDIFNFVACQRCCGHFDPALCYYNSASPPG